MSTEKHIAYPAIKQANGKYIFRDKEGYKPRYNRYKFNYVDFFLVKETGEVFEALYREEFYKIKPNEFMYLCKRVNTNTFDEVYEIYKVRNVWKPHDFRPKSSYFVRKVSDCA